VDLFGQEAPLGRALDDILVAHGAVDRYETCSALANSGDGEAAIVVERYVL
jgi:hypothetical protein